MGGKHKQAQRTKNNARPSSSGRSAELLGNQAPKFVGFGATKDGGYVPVLPGFSLGGSDVLDPNISADFQLVLKKMNKKDSTTKLKALQEFADLVGSCKEQDISTVLPFWPRLYGHLAVDAEHRVREAAHHAQHSVVKCMRRNLAPYLRQLIGPWFTSQYDTYSPAASAATQSFKEAFPPNKVPEVIVFCQNEILNYIYDNIIVQKPQTIGNPQVMTKEELEAKYERMLVSSLHGYALYLEVLPSEKLDLASDSNKKIISSKKFWKFNKHPVPMVRAAWFKAVVALCQKTPELLSEESSQVALAVFSNLDEADPVVLSAVWEAALHALTSLKDCWSHISVEKLVLPKLWNVLRKGGQGSAATIFPNLLPLLSRIPDHIFPDKLHFSSSFFAHMRQGFGQRSVYQSISESNAVAKCYTECLRFVLVKHFEKQDLCIDLIENHLVPALEFTLRNDSSSGLTQALYLHVSLLACSWDEDERYSPLRVAFWKRVGSCVMNVLQDETHQHPASWVLDRVLLLCCCLEDPSYHMSRHQRRVKFAEEEPPVCESVPVPRSPISSSLQAFIQDICKVFLQRMNAGGFSYFLPYLAELTRKFGNDQLLQFLGSLTGDCPSLLAWCKNIVSEWLALGGEAACAPQVIKFAFVLLQLLPRPDQLPLLEYLAQVAQDGSLLVWFLEAVTQHHDIPTVSKWLSGDGCRTLLLSLARQTIASELSAEARNVMKDMLKTTPPHGDLLLPVHAVESVLQVYCEVLSGSWHAVADPSLVVFVSKVVSALYSGDLTVSPGLRSSSVCQDLVLLLFDGSCSVGALYQGLHAETTAAWETAVGALSRTHGAASETFRAVVNRFAAVLHQKLLEPLEPEDSAVYYLALDVAWKLLRCSARDPTGSLDRTALAILHHVVLETLSRSLHPWQEQAADLCHYAMSAAALLHFPGAYPGVVSATPKHVPNFCRLFALSMFSALLLAKFYNPALKVQPASSEQVPGGSASGDSDNDGGDDDEQDDDDIDDDFVQGDTFNILKDHIISLLYTSTLGSTFSSHYHATGYANAIQTKLEALCRYSQELLNALGPNDIRDLSTSICNRASKMGGLWLIVTNELPLTGPLDFACFDILECSGISRLNAIQMYPSLKTPAKSEEPPPFIQDVLSATHVNDETLAVAASWCSSGSFSGVMDVLHRCVPYACEQLKHEIQLWGDDRDVRGLSWEDVSKTVRILNFVSSVLSKSDVLSKEGGEDLSSQLCCLVRDAATVLVCLLRRVYCVRSELLVPSARLRAPLSHVQFTKVPRAARGSPDDCKVQTFAIAVLRLLVRALRTYQPLKESWGESFCEDTYETVFQLFTYVAELTDTHMVTCHDQLLLECLANAIMSFETDMIFTNWKIDDAVKMSSDLLSTTETELQLVGYHWLKSLVKRLVLTDAKTLGTCPLDAEDEAFVVDDLSIWQLEPVLDNTQALVESVLRDMSVGDCCLVRPYTDSFAFARGYLCVWNLLLVMCADADTDLRFHYAAQLSKKEYVSSLLQILFCLMPEDVIHLKKSRNLEFLNVHPSSAEITAVGSKLTSESLQDWVCLVYLHTLQRLPAVVRQWWSELDSRTSTLVEQVTMQYMSPTLCNMEMESLQCKNGNMTVHVYGSAREVVAKYHIEDVALELSVVLPPNHPLGLVKVESVNRQPMVEHANWRNWIMQLTIFLAHQNGSLWDGLNLWKSNLDKRFQGIEECYICFSILHGLNFQIPRIRCNTCRKKFHSHCMYKWFDTSNKSTCPICRNSIF